MLIHENLETALPTRTSAMIFRGKATLLQLRRSVNNAFGETIRKFEKASRLADAPVIASSVTPLWTEAAAEEHFLVAGKIENLRRAAKLLNGIEIPAGELFSFWKHIGRATRRRGFTVGREIREGCVIPNLGGGLCQLSNALYSSALAADCEIIERHAHSRVIAGSLAEQGLDATVFWNYIDLRFRPRVDLRIEVLLDRDDLTVRFRGVRAETDKTAEQTKPRRRVLHESEPNSCATCGEGDCFRSLTPAETHVQRRTAFLVDDFSNEFDRYISEKRTPADVLMIPLDGKRFRKANYAWRTDGFAAVRQSAATAFVRSYRSRRLSAQGAARQKNLLAMNERLALRYAEKLRPDMLHVVIHQNLLPYLWRNGDLGGRTFDVLMTALPMAEIQNRLDTAFVKHPESTTLGDFRADGELLADEIAALSAASKIVTTHTDIAELFPHRAVLLEREMPNAAPREPNKNAKPTVVFPATTVGRKGCYELREALRGHDVHLVLLGPLIESDDFWEGFDVSRGDENALYSADLVVLPAYVEHRPTRLLKAAAAGVPVLASKACGVANVAGIETFDINETGILGELIGKYLEK